MTSHQKVTIVKVRSETLTSLIKQFEICMIYNYNINPKDLEHDHYVRDSQ